MDIQQLKNILEAALLANPHPMSPQQLGALFGEEETVSHDDIAQALAVLREDCEGRGVELVEVASGFRYQVRQEAYPWVSRLWTERPSRYSRALLETLALIAYRQPITRGEIEQIRGVVVSSNIIKTLEEREWIRVVGHRDVPGKPSLFGTTRIFLDYFNLKSLDELPTLAEIRDLDELDPQFNFDQPIRAQAAVSNEETGSSPETAEPTVLSEIDPGEDTHAATASVPEDEGATINAATDEVADAAPPPRATAVEAEAGEDTELASPNDIQENRT